MKKRSLKILTATVLIFLMLMPYLEVSASTIYYLGVKTLGAAGDSKVISSEAFAGGNERTGTVPHDNVYYDKSDYYRYITTVTGITAPGGASTGEIFIRDIVGHSANDANASFYCLDPTNLFPPDSSGTDYTSIGVLSEMTDEELSSAVSKDITVNDLTNLLNNFYYHESIGAGTYQAYFEKVYKDRLTEALEDMDNDQDKIYQYLTDDDIKVAQQWALWREVSDADFGASPIIQRDLNGTEDDDTPDHGAGYKSDRNAMLISLAEGYASGFGELPTNEVILDTDSLSHLDFIDGGVEYADYGTFKIETTLIDMITNIRIYDKEYNDITNDGEYEIFVGEPLAMGTNYGTPISGTLIDNMNNPNLLNHEFFLRFTNPEENDSVRIIVTYVKERTVDAEIFVADNSNYQSIIKIETRPVLSILSHQYNRPGDMSDLALRKFITQINGEDVDSREPVVTEINSAINKGSQTTAHYAHKKNPLLVEHGDTVTYTMRIYNESTIDGNLTSVTDILPAGLSLKTGPGINTNWTVINNLADGRTVIRYTLDPSFTIPGAVLEVSNYRMFSTEITVDILVDNDAAEGLELTNISFINAQEEEDIDSEPGNLSKDGLNSLISITNSELPNYRGHGNDSQTLDQATWYYRGYEDDDDFEKVILRPFDLALRKYITDINGTAHDREPVVDVTPLTNGSNNTTATYTHPKNYLLVEKGDVVTYKIRVYNEGGLAGYVTQIKDHLPEGLGFILNHKTNLAQGWVQDGTKVQLTEAEKLEMPFLTRVDLTDIAPKDAADNYDINENAISATEIDIVKGDVAIITDFARNQLLPAFNSALGSDGLSYVEVEVASIVLEDRNGMNLRNLAEISDFTDEDGNPITDRDSEADDLLPGRIDGPYDDDEDYEALNTVAFDLALRKFITNVNDDGNPNTAGDAVDRVPTVNSNALVNGTSTTAIYSHPKTPVVVQKGDLVTYTIRVYNEGLVDGYVREIRDFLPKGLAYLPQHRKNIDNEWVVESGTNSTVTDYPTIDIKLREDDLVGVTNLDNAVLVVDSPVLTTRFRENNLLRRFLPQTNDMEYIDVEIVAVVLEDRELDSNDAYIGNLRNWAEIAEDADEHGNPATDRDSTPGNLNGHPDGPYEDDEDSEDLATEPMVFDLALQKFITQIDSTAEVRTKTPTQLVDRRPEINIDSNDKITYTKENTKPPLVGYKDVVTYTIRVYNEGDISGFAKKVRDTIPEGVTYLPTNETNLKYQWYFIDENGDEVTDIEDAKFIETEYLSRDAAMDRESRNEEPDVENTILEAFDKDTKTVSYRDLQIVFEVNEKATPGANNLRDIAEISDDEDEDGNVVDDIDSTPGNENPDEDDIDEEDLEVTYFDLALLKIVTNVELTENEKVKDISTGHTFDMIPEPIVKTDLDERYLDKTQIKYTYKIRVFNQGFVEGYATEVSDYIPEGLEFYEEDQKNNKWSKVEGEAKRVVTTDLAAELLKPGEYTTIEIVLRWINHKNNMGVKTNIAEISKDHNEQELPDIDSIPGNRKPGEDDIDDASVMVAIRTGAAETFFTVSLTMAIIVGLGTVLIKKYIV